VDQVQQTWMERVQQTWDELGHKLRPLRFLTLVRTDPHESILPSGIILPPKLDNFHSGMPHQQIKTGTVVAVGPRTKTVKVGDRVCFQRLHFAWLRKLGSDKTFVGWINNNDIIGFVTNEGQLVQKADDQPAASAAP